jgi:hypothetical protein
LLASQESAVTGKFAAWNRDCIGKKAMSDTSKLMSSLLVEQFGIRAAEIAPDSPLESLGMHAADLEN